MADLYPIVIPPIEHTFKSIKYTCAGEGLIKDVYFYDPHAERFLPPKSTKAGVEPKDIEKKQAGWWKAQCAFRGLNQTGNLNDLQTRMRDAKRKMLLELKELEKELNKEFRLKNELARGEGWVSLKTPEQKAKDNPEKYLQEVFPKGTSGWSANPDVVVLKIEVSDRARVTKAAEKMKLHTISVEAPWAGPKKPSVDRWLIIGRTLTAITDQMRKIEEQTSRSKEEHSPKKAVSKPSIKETPVPVPSLASRPTPHNPSNVPLPQQALPRKKQTARKNAAGYGHRDEELNELYPAPLPGGPPQKMKAWHKTKDAFVLSEDEDEKAKPRPKQTARKSASGYGSRDEELNERFPPPPVGAPPQKMKAWHTKKQTARKSAYHISDDEEEEEGLEASKTKMGQDPWDVRGSWVISCPDIAGQWDLLGEMSLYIFIERCDDAHQMYGVFDFGIITGVMRFEKPTTTSRKPKGDQEATRKRKREDDDNDLEETDMYSYPAYGASTTEQISSTYTESSFYLGAKDKPTARRPTWIYRWRGEETGEGQIQLGSDSRTSTVTFKRSGKDLTLEGVFKGGFTGDCKFTGTLAGRGGEGRSPKVEWENRSQAEYDRAERNRWGGSNRW